MLTSLPGVDAGPGECDSLGNIGKCPYAFRYYTFFCTAQ